MPLVNKIRSIMSKKNADDFLLNTDYEMDKIVFSQEGHFVKTVSIPHSLKFTPLIFGVWSTDENFTTVNSIGVQEDDPVIPGLYTPILNVTGESYSNNIKLTAYGENSSTATIYYRLYALEPSDSAQNAPLTSKQAGSLIFNNDYNYRKLLAKGEFTQDNSEFTHNLGYIPQVMAWSKYSARFNHVVMPIMSSSEWSDFRIIVTDKKIIAVSGSSISGGLIEKIYWRIYYDKA